jgi:hypothetical protein
VSKNSSYYLEEIKVRWKKAAPENNNSYLFINNGRYDTNQIYLEKILG